ncbi:MAG TPA: family 16 glycoside hydrolase, partial [Chthoniobacteraceae bacterium]|nr:family 16 glycoside hydrolase [Chthoniobacteraceae bacterium]
HAILENYYDKKLPPEQRRPILPRGPIELQTHGGEIRWRNIFVREIGSDEADQILASHGEDPGFKSIFNGKDLTGWQNAVDDYEVRDGAIVCKKGKGGDLLTKEEYGDFVVRLEMKIPPGGNNGLAIRCPIEGHTAYNGMCEVQVLDDNYEVNKSKIEGKPVTIDPRQAHGSAYGMVAAARGYQHPIDEWNFEEVTVRGPTIKVELNGTVILDTDLSKVDMSQVMGGKNGPSAHPGKDRTTGFFGFAGHTDPVMFRNVRIKRL